MTPEAYAWTTFQDPFAVYVKVAVDWKTCASRRAYRKPCAMTYVGSTAVSVTLREANGMSVLRKLERGQKAQAELAIRYRRQNACFNRFMLIKIASCCSYKEAWTLEHALILRWQPKLNCPFVRVFLKHTALGFRPGKQRRHSSYAKFGIRLWRKRDFGSGYTHSGTAGDMLHGTEASLEDDLRCFQFHPSQL